MRPPICEVCDRRADEDDAFALLTFADHEPLPDGMVGHPAGLHWLCPDHADAMADLTDRPWAEALAALDTR